MIKNIKGTSESYISGYSHMVNSCIESENKSHEVIMDSYKMRLNNLGKMQDNPGLSFEQWKEIDNRHEKTIERMCEEKTKHNRIVERILEHAEGILMLIIALFVVRKEVYTENNGTK